MKRLRSRRNKKKGYQDKSKTERRREDKTGDLVNGEIPDRLINQSRIKKDLDELYELTYKKQEGCSEVIVKKQISTHDNPGNKEFDNIMVDMEFDFEPDTVFDEDESGIGKLLLDDFSLCERPIPSSFVQKINGNSSHCDLSHDQEGRNKINGADGSLYGRNDAIIKDNSDWQNQPIYNEIEHHHVLTRLPEEIKVPSSPASFGGILQFQKETTKKMDEKSLLSFDETTVSPSIAFFLGSNIQQLHDDGISIAENDFGEKIKSNNSLNDVQKMSFETDDTKTTKGYSIASSKHTVDTAKISELRERKRLMERRFECKYNVLPSMIEVSKFPTY